MDKYLNVFYNFNLKPKTDYPAKLANYLINRYKIQPGAEILDVGCGRGDLLRAFAKEGLLTQGLDLMPYDMELTAGLPIKHANFESERFPFEDESFDLVFSKSVIEHLHKPDNFLREARRVLKTGGRLIIMTPDWQTQLYTFYNDHTHVQPYIVSGLINALKLYELNDVTAELFYQLPSVWKFPFLKIFYKPLQLLFPVKKVRKSSWWRWARELMILGSAIK
ncbi:MAG: methyltransferase domain-containing protein [Candidatus Doudnabacteria bacterium]|nr:methyltransferase domain-containing protein [Candidatus Doudnabacteria bacterium]